MDRWTYQITNNNYRSTSANPFSKNLSPSFSFAPWHLNHLVPVDDQGIALPLHLVFGRAGATQEAAAQDPAGGTVSTHTKRGRWGEKR